MKNYGKKGFEKAFLKAVPNFDETIAHFSHPSKNYEQSNVNVVWNGKLWHFKMYKSDYYIDIWKNHFIEFFNTGQFDYNGYWRKYSSKQVKGGELENEDFGQVYKIPLCKRFGNDFYEYSPEMNEFLKSSDGKGVGGKYGIHLVSKPV